ncbi:protein IMPAIRED IN BABA-INDUCED STERILITY 1-like [Aristolochia californica]|uniref:protein IMPAIRED IN BABA-INDUCED STERILITY 1-like n=1 Tax=Aristolochia californica TaxID=171875 RepID=UPI0035D6CDCE
MGCISSKQAVSVTPALDYSSAFRDQNSNILLSSLRNQSGRSDGSKHNAESVLAAGEPVELRRLSSHGSHSVSLRLGNLHKYVEGEQVAAGWPAWLTAVAGEAIHGWVPLKADKFEKLEKIGQGTYSSVFRARDLDTGKIVALKKVRFDNFDPESVRFMAREIQILRRLDHPNIVKLEGLIASKLSCSIYLVFEYMDHDLAGLSSSPDINFSESQVKCYMHQLLSGLNHCHSRGIMHRDIKGSNLLVNNEGILKMADFGLANFYNSGQRQPLTSRVVTLWYRPPELLLGSTDYGASVDLWSVGCVFSELLLGKPILQGRTEIEQLHKIFKLCGSPPDEYWKKSKLPHATIFKPQQPYESCLRETCKRFPATTLSLIETLLSIEPYKRGTAASALNSKYFMMKPYACDPSSLPKYPPNKEIDAKSREEARRKKVSGRVRGSEAGRKQTKVTKVSWEATGLGRLGTLEPCIENAQGTHDRTDAEPHCLKEDCLTKQNDEPRQAAFNPPDEAFHAKHNSLGDIPYSGPLVPPSNGFAWVKKRKEANPISRSHSRSSSKGLVPVPDYSITQRRNISNGGARVDSKGRDYDLAKHAMMKQWHQFERPDSFDGSDMFHSQDFSDGFQQRDELRIRRNVLGYQDDGERVEFSGPLMSQLNKVDEILQRNERHIRQAVRRSWFQRGKKQQGK